MSISLDKSIFSLLESIPDPEIPVINIVELGVVRNVKIFDSIPEITITPTYSGCPAMKMIEDEIRTCLQKNGIEKFTIKKQFSPAWTTDWMNENTREKLRTYGIAPPHGNPENGLGVLPAKKIPVTCPSCSSAETKCQSQFGSTPCKALYFCNNCLETFDYFKCH